jgi:RNA polymerase sigma-70 factor (ECF subfamily)
MTPIRTLRPLARAVLSTQSDERLVLLARGGSEDAFAEIVRRHRPGLLRLARSLGSGDRADDVVQDGLVRAWRALRRSEAEIDLRPWLTTIVRNRALSSHASNRIHEELDETIDGVRQPGEIVLMREELRSAVSAVNSLPESQREALVRSALAGESHDQIASALATTPGAVRQLIFRARTGLREAVGALVPFPVVRSLAELSTGGAAAGGTAVALAGGGALGLKALTVIAIGAAVTGSGIAIERHASGADPQPVRQVAVETAQPTAQARAEPSTDLEAKSATDAALVAEPSSASPSRSQDLALTEGSRSSSSRVASAGADVDDPADPAEEPVTPVPANGPTAGGTGDLRDGQGGGDHPGADPGTATAQPGGGPDHQQQPPPAPPAPPDGGSQPEEHPGTDHGAGPPEQGPEHDDGAGAPIPAPAVDADKLGDLSLPH